MARYIDVDNLAEMINARAEMLVEGKEAFFCVAGWLNKLPTADVVEVVRCKDCCNSEQCGSVLYCTHFSHNVEENDYCSQGG